MEKHIGIYIHIPFCVSKCSYCNFYSLAGKDKLMPEYQEALLRHIREYSPQLDGYLIDTVYFGGGTPGHYGAARLIGLLTALKKYGHVLLDSEITAEINPRGVTKEDLLKLRRAGFNRLSVGMQSANDKMLDSIGRQHTFSDVEDTVKNARDAGFKNISLDIIYGLPSQNKDDWANTITMAASLKPEHISCYGLKIEEGTPMYIFKDSPFVPDDDAQADMYLYAVEAFSRFGYRQYEISNFARRGFESKHNMKYWLGEEYLGFGPAAHSYIGKCRFDAVEDLEKYIERIESGTAVIENSVELSEFEEAGEYLMLRLRTAIGISEEEYYDIYKLRLDPLLELLRKFEANGLAQKKDGRWRLTAKGFLVSNPLIGALLEAQTKQRTKTSRPWQYRTEEDEKQMTLFDSNQVSLGLFGTK